MKVNGTIYKDYFSLRGTNVEGEETEKMPEEKWYNLAMMEKLAEFKETLKECESLSDVKMYQCLVKLVQIIENNMNNPVSLLNGKAKCEFFDIALDVVSEQMDNKSNNLTWPMYDELVDAYEDFGDYLDDWTKLVWTDDVGARLVNNEELKDCQLLKDLVEDMTYYSSVRSNPNMEYIDDSKKTLKELVKWAKKAPIDFETKDQLKSYFVDVKDYLDVLTQLISNQNKKKNKR